MTSKQEIDKIFETLYWGKQTPKTNIAPEDLLATIEQSLNDPTIINKYPEQTLKLAHKLVKSLVNKQISETKVPV